MNAARAVRRSDVLVVACVAARIASQGANGVTGASDPNARGIPARCMLAKGLSARARSTPSRSAVHSRVAAPERIEHRLDAGENAESREQRLRVLVDHLDMLESVLGRSHVSSPTTSDASLEPGDHQVHRAVSDDVVAGLDAGASSMPRRDRE